MPDDLPIDLPDPEQCFSSVERSRLALRAIQSLKSRDRALLQLSLLDGLGSAEIAAKMGLSPELVRKRKSRALLRVRGFLKEKGSRNG